MTERTVIETHLDLVTRDEAAAVLAAIGMTVSEAIELMLTRVARDRALPFEPFVPNEVTTAAMMEARKRTGMRRAGSVAELMVGLDAEDD